MCDYSCEQDEGRTDEFGNFVENAYKLNFYRDEFKAEKDNQTRAVNVTMKSLPDGVDLSDLECVYDLLDLVEINYDNLLAIDQVGAKTFILDFSDV